MKPLFIVFGLVLLAGMYFSWQDTDLDTSAVSKSEENSETAADFAFEVSEGVEVAENLILPLSGSVPTENVKHTINPEEIRQGCFRQDCIPSIDTPAFISTAAAAKLLQPESLGIALSYEGVHRFYPFPMLETHELVNDFIANDPILISYCPLCGTGIVFSREIDGEAVEFGVSGMLWQSNLLMYNRADSLSDRNLWSQVLGQAVVGERSGQTLSVIPSDIMRFSDWRQLGLQGEVLAGMPADPYDGRYYEVASRFAPSFNTAAADLDPSTYVYGIEVGGVYKAYPKFLIPSGLTTDVVNGVTLTIQNVDGVVTFKEDNGRSVSDIEGFWFSWQSAHPDTLIFQ